MLTSMFQSATLSLTGPSVFDQIFRTGSVWGGLHVALAFVAAGLCLSSLTLAVQWWSRSADAETRVAASSSDSRLPWIATGVLCVVTLASLSSFQFRFDDFGYLVRAAEAPWEFDSTLRVLSVNTLYRIGVLLGGGPAFFVITNLVMHALAVVLLRSLFLRAGCDRDEALLGAVLFGLGPGQIDLLVAGFGFQPTAGICVIFAVMLAVDAAADSDEHTRPSGRALATWACFLAAAGMFVKYPIVAFLPVYWWAWARFVRPRGGSEAWTSLLPVWVGAAIVGPLVMAHPLTTSAGEFDKAGLTGIPVNLLKAAIETAMEFVKLLILVRILSFSAADDRADSEIENQLELGRGFEFVSKVWCAVWHELRSSPFRWLAVVAVVPFLLNRHYFASYYMMPAFAWLSLIEARVLLSLVRVDQAAPWALVLAAVVLVPWIQVATNFYNPKMAQQHEFLSALHAATRGLEQPGAIEIVPSCLQPPATAETREAIEQLIDETGYDSLLWATGWHRVRVLALDGDHETHQEKGLAVYYCRGEPVRIRHWD